MIEMEMSRDIQDFSPKVISFLSKRQLVCMAAGLAYSLPVFLALEGVDITIRISILAGLMTPAIACGWVKMYGMPLERFFIKCVIPMFITPRKRKYMTVNKYEIATPEEEKERLVSFKDIPKKKLKRKEKKARKLALEKYDGRA